jgi:hypothetical protein
MGDTASEDLISKLLEQGRGLLTTIIPTARKAISVIEKLESGELSVRVSAAQERRITLSQEAQTKRIVRSVIGSALFVSGIILLPQAAFAVFSYVLMGLGGLLMLMQLMASEQKKQRRRRHPGL